MDGGDVESACTGYSDRMGDSSGDGVASICGEMRYGWDSGVRLNSMRLEMVKVVDECAVCTMVQVGEHFGGINGPGTLMVESGSERPVRPSGHDEARSGDWRALSDGG